MEMNSNDKSSTNAKKYIMYFDGASRGNPGLSGAGAVIYEQVNNKLVEIWSKSQFIGKSETNNIAEYGGLILGLKYAVEMDIHHLIVRGDSELVIKQVKGTYKVKSPHLIVLHKTVCDLNTHFNTIEYQHVYRDKNKRADELSNLGIQNNVNTSAFYSLFKK
jgi:ribonuclease HI